MDIITGILFVVFGAAMLWRAVTDSNECKCNCKCNKEK